MSRIYTAAVPVPELLRPTWGADSEVLVLVATSSPTRAAKILGVPANKLGTVPEGVVVGAHDESAARTYEDTPVYRSPLSSTEWRVIEPEDTEA